MARSRGVGVGRNARRRGTRGAARRRGAGIGPRARPPSHPRRCRGDSAVRSGEAPQGPRSDRYAPSRPRGERSPVVEGGLREPRASLPLALRRPLPSTGADARPAPGSGCRDERARATVTASRATAPRPAPRTRSRTRSNSIASSSSLASSVRASTATVITIASTPGAAPPPLCASSTFSWARRASTRPVVHPRRRRRRWTRPHTHPGPSLPGLEPGGCSRSPPRRARAPRRRKHSSRAPGRRPGARDPVGRPVVGRPEGRGLRADHSGPALDVVAQHRQRRATRRTLARRIGGADTHVVRCGDLVTGRDEPARRAPRPGLDERHGTPRPRGPHGRRRAPRTHRLGAPAPRLLPRPRRARGPALALRRRGVTR